MKYLAIICCFFGIILQLHSQGFIVPNGVSSGGNNMIFVSQNPTNSDYTGFALAPQNANTFSFIPIADEGVRVFLVSSNQPVSLSPILANSYTELLFPNAYVFNSGSPFYLGFYTGYNPFDEHGGYTGIYTDPLFGWGQFVNNNGTIQMLGSALEYGGGGIYVGTQNIIGIPEPGTIALTALGTLLLGFHRWRKFARRR